MAKQGQHTGVAPPGLEAQPSATAELRGRVRAGRSSDLGSPGKPTATPPSQGQRQRADVRPREQAPGEVHATKRGRSVDPAPASQMQEGTRKPAGARHASGARASGAREQPRPQTRPQAAEGQHTRAARPQVGVSQMTPTKTSGRVRAKGSPGKPTAAALGVLSANPEQQQGAAHPREWASSEGPTDLRTSRPVQPGTAAEQQQGRGKPKPGSQPQHPDGHSEDGPDRPEHPAGRKHPEWLGTRRMEQDHGHKSGDDTTPAAGSQTDGEARGNLSTRGRPLGSRQKETVGLENMGHSADIQAAMWLDIDVDMPLSHQIPETGNTELDRIRLGYMSTSDIIASSERLTRCGRSF